MTPILSDHTLTYQPPELYEGHTGSPALIAEYQQWIDAGVTTGALGLTGDESVSAVTSKFFTMSMRLTYTRPPQVSQVLPADLHVFDTSGGLPSPTLSASGSDPDGDALSYKFFVRQFNYQTQQFEPFWETQQWLGNPSVSVGGLSPNGLYAWSAAASDGWTASESGWRTFGTSNSSYANTVLSTPTVLPGQLDTLTPTWAPSDVTGAGIWFWYCAYRLDNAPPGPWTAPSATLCTEMSSGWVTGQWTYQTPPGAFEWGAEYGVYVWVRSGSFGTPVAGQQRAFTTKVAAINRLRSVSLDSVTGVDAATGNFVVSRTDVKVASPSGLLGIARTYNSASTAVGAFGPGWSSMLDQRVVWESAKPGLWLYLADGSAEFHGRNPDGSFDDGFGTTVTKIVDSGLPVGVSWRVTDANETVFDYDSTGRLVKIRDRDSHETVFGPRALIMVDDGDGGQYPTYQQAITDTQANRTLTVWWTSMAATATVGAVATQPVGGQVLWWSYGYTGGNLTSACSPAIFSASDCERYGYTAGKLTTVVPGGRTLPSMTVTYHAGRVASWANTAGNTYAYSLPVLVTGPNPGSGSVREVSITDPRGSIRREQFNEWMQIVQTIDQAGKSRVWEYSATSGLLIRTTDEAGGTEVFTYDADGDLTVKVDALGRRFEYTYDATHRKLSETSPMGFVTTYTYDTPASNLWSEEVLPSTTGQSSVASRTTRTERTSGTEIAVGSGLMPKGLVRSIIDPFGRVTLMDYDAKGDLRRLTDPAGKVTEYTYDELGRELTKTATWLNGDNLLVSATWTTTWTALSQKSTVTEPAVVNTAASPPVTHQRRTEWQYDVRGNITRIRDVDVTGGDPTRETLFEFDLLDREWRTTAPDGGVTTRTFDANSNVVTVTDPLGRIYTTVYNTRNLVSSVSLSNYTTHNGGIPQARLVRSTTYTDRGQIDVETDALGRQVKHRYDATGREYQTELVTYVKPDGSVISPFVTNYKQFDLDGRVIREDTGNGMLRVDRTFDARDRVITERVYNTGSQDRLYTYSYNALSNVVSKTVTCPTACTQTTLQERTAYDTAGRPMQQIIENGATDLITVTRYDQAGNPVAVTDPRGTSNPPVPLAAYTTTTRYDVLGRPNQILEPLVTVDTVTPGTAAGVTSTVASKTFDLTTDGVVASFGVSSATQTTTQARTGIGSLQVTPQSTQWAVTSDQYPTPNTSTVTAGKRYTFSVWAKAATAGATLTIDVRWLDSSGSVIVENNDRPGVSANSTGWTEIAVTAIAPAGAANVQPVIRTTTTAPAGAIHYLDDYSMSTTNETVALTAVANKGFESTLDNMTVTSGATAVPSNTFARTGSRSLAINATATWSVGESAPGTAISTTEKYQLTGWHRTSGGETLLIPTVIWVNSAGTVLRQDSAYTWNYTTTWSQLATHILTPPAGATHARIQLSGFAPSNGTGVTWHIDDLVLARVTTTPAAASNATTSTTTASPTTTIGYNTFGDTTHTVDPNGNRTVTGFDTSGRRTSITHPTYTAPGATPVTPTETFAYDQAGNMTSRVDRLGQTWTFVFDSFNQAVLEKAPKAAPSAPQPVTETRYDLVGNPVFTWDPTGAFTVTGYDNLNRPRSVTQYIRPYGAQTNTEYPTTSFDYDALGKLISTTTPTGAITTQVYSPTGELLEQTLPAGSTVARSVYTYDLAGRVLTTTDPVGRRVTNTYDAAGRVVTATQYASAAAGGAALATTGFGYDEASNQTSVTRPEGDRTDYTYDPLSQLRTVTEQTGLDQSAWWRLGETSGTTAADSSASPANGDLQGTFTLNQTGAPTGVTNPAILFTGGRVDVPVARMTGNTKTYSLWFKTSSNGVLLSKTNAVSGSVPTSYTPLMYVGTDGRLYGGTSAGQMISTIATVNNNVWRRAVLTITPTSQRLYLDGVLVGTVSAAAVMDSWATKAYIATGYTAGYPATSGGWMPFNGTIDEVAVYNQPVGDSMTGTTAAAQVTAPGTQVTSYGYDAVGNPTRTIDAKNNSWWQSYNTWNLPETLIEPSATVTPVEAETDRSFTITYTRAGQPASERSPGGIRVDHVYDNRGQLTLSTGIGAGGWQMFSRDLDGRVTAATNAAGSINYTYDDRDLLATATGTGGNSSFIYDLSGRMISRTDAAGTATFTWTNRGELYAMTEPATGRTLVHTYNEASETTGINYDNANATAARRTFTHDSFGRVATDVTVNTSNVTTVSTAYTYDRNNNITTKAVGPAAVAGVGVNRYFYDRGNRLVNWINPTGAPNEYAYDPNGNRTRNGGVTTSYDLRNRINVHGTTTYSWAPRGVLNSTTTAGITTNFTHDAFNQMTGSGTITYNYDALGRTTTRTAGTTTAFTYAGTGMDPTGDGTYLYSRTPGGRAVAVAQGATRTLANLDRHGDLTATLTTAGNTAATVNYDPYGTVTASTGSRPSIGYQADWTDPTNGLVNMGARWYQPATGGFTTRDAYKGRQDTPVSLNRYTYANNNPLLYFDPTGYASADTLERQANIKKATQAKNKAAGSPVGMLAANAQAKQSAATKQMVTSAIALAGHPRPSTQAPHAPTPRTPGVPGERPCTPTCAPPPPLPGGGGSHGSCAGACATIDVRGEQLDRYTAVLYYCGEQCEDDSGGGNFLGGLWDGFKAGPKFVWDASGDAIRCGTPASTGCVRTLDAAWDGTWKAVHDPTSIYRACMDNKDGCLGEMAGGVLVGGAAKKLFDHAPGRTWTDPPRVDRLDQDIHVDPKAPAPMSLRRPIGLSASQNQAAQDHLNSALLQGATDARVNQQQVNLAGVRVGMNRPDLQYTLDGVRYYVEFDTESSVRAIPHADRIISNDPSGLVLLLTKN